jgi:hypothetical protein
MKRRLINIKKNDKLVLKDTITKSGEIIITVTDDNSLRIELIDKKYKGLDLGTFSIYPKNKRELAIFCGFLN